MSRPRFHYKPALKYLNKVDISAAQEAKLLRQQEERLTINFPTLVVTLMGKYKKSDRRDETSITNLPPEVLRLIAHLALPEQVAMNYRLRRKLSQPWTLRWNIETSTIKLIQEGSPATRKTRTGAFFSFLETDFPHMHETDINNEPSGDWRKPLDLTAIACK